MINSRTGVNQYPKSSSIIPNHRHTGFDNRADVEPVIAKTINKSTSWKLDSIFQRFLIPSFYLYDYKYSNIILEEHNQKFLFIGILKKDHIVIN
jgi:hypothetical protein